MIFRSRQLSENQRSTTEIDREMNSGAFITGRRYMNPLKNTAVPVIISTD